MTPAEAEATWSAIDDQRRRTADLLEQLTEQQWRHPSLCRGWNVRHVAAHLTLQHQRVRDVATFVARNPSMLRSVTLNRTIHDSAVIPSQLPTEEIVRLIRAMIGSRRHNAFVTPLETLTDILVHSQDIAVPLGLDLTMAPTASALAATRRWDTRDTWLAKVFHALPLEDYRLRATDADWTRGEGPRSQGRSAHSCCCSPVAPPHSPALRTRRGRAAHLPSGRHLSHVATPHPGWLSPGAGRQAAATLAGQVQALRRFHPLEGHPVRQRDRAGCASTARTARPLGLRLAACALHRARSGLSHEPRRFLLDLAASARP